jgi:hypothetical protein
MTIAAGKRVTRKGQDRLHDRLNTILILNSAIATAGAYHRGEKLPFQVAEDEYRLGGKSWSISGSCPSGCH